VTPHWWDVCARAVGGDSRYMAIPRQYPPQPEMESVPCDGCDNFVPTDARGFVQSYGCAARDHMHCSQACADRCSRHAELDLDDTED
jgi:hypothetical protein